jgi:ribosomal-protein-alanine N-acetyltransferase
MNDLEDLIPIERASHLAPWSVGNFSDSLTAGYWAYCLKQLPEENNQNNPLLAYCVLMPGVDDLSLLNITVNPLYRRKGLARKVLESIEHLAVSRDLYKIFLEVRLSNEGAIKLYESLGYRQVGIRKDYYPLHEGVKESASVMLKELRDL